MLFDLGVPQDFEAGLKLTIFSDPLGIVLELILVLEVSPRLSGGIADERRCAGETTLESSP